jgi:hypothetical protein
MARVSLLGVKSTEIERRVIRVNEPGSATEERHVRAPGCIPVARHLVRPREVKEAVLLDSPAAKVQSSEFLRRVPPVIPLKRFHGLHECGAQFR